MKEKLIRFVSDEILSGTVEVSGDDGLLEEGMVDSLGMVRLVGFIEDSFGFQVPPVDFTIENFQSIDSLTAYLNNRLSVDRHDA